MTSARPGLAGRVAAAAGGGLLVALSLPPWGWWPLAFFGIAIFDASLGAIASRRHRALLGAVFAFLWLMVATAWMWQLTAPGYVVANVIFSCYHAAAALAAPTGRLRVLGRPLAHALVETLRMSFPFGGVPLATLGIAQVGGPFAGLARIGGVVAITWFVFQVGFLLGPACRAVARLSVPTGRTLRPAMVGGAIAATLVALAAVAPSGAGTGRHVDVVVVQGGGEQGTSAEEVPSRVVTERHLEATRTLEPDDDLALVVWPENVIDVATFDGSDEFTAVAAEAKRLGVPIAVGVTEDVPGQPDRFTNAQVIVTPDGTLAGRYDKVRRVPFGEYVPLRNLLESLGAPVDQIGRDALAGTTPAVVDVPATGDGDPFRVGVVISWEVFFGGRAREGVTHGGAFVINPTNGASYTGTIVQTQQVASSRLRAIETGRWVVQAAPTGFSEFVTPHGTVIDRTSVGERAVIRHSIELRTGRTWYVALGDRPFVGALIAAYAAVAALSLNARSSRPRLDQDGVTGR